MRKGRGVLQNARPSRPLHCIRAIRGQKGRVRKRAWKALQSVAMVMPGTKSSDSRDRADVPGRHYATGQVNKALIALVTIRATDPVAIYPLQRFVSIRAIRGQ